MREYFIINGVLNPGDLLSINDIIPIQFVNLEEDKKILKIFYCSVIMINDTNCILKCDTSNQPIKTTTNNINNAKSINSTIFLLFNIKQEDFPVETPYNINSEDKSSLDDFSIGVFVAIIIACIIIIVALTIEQSKFEFIAFCIMSVLLLVTFIKEWIDLFSCGIVESCLTKKKKLQYFMKYSMSLFITILAFLMAKRSIYKRDGILIRFSYSCSMCADFSFSIIKAFFPDSVLNTILGITFFIGYQCIMIFRHSRDKDDDNHFPKVYIAPICFLLVFIVLFAVGLFSITISIVAVYASTVVCSLIISIRAPCKNFYPARNALLIRWGMVLFTIGDFMVGVEMLSGDDHSAMLTIASVANNLVWIFYLPGQLLLIFSCVAKIFNYK